MAQRSFRTKNGGGGQKYRAAGYFKLCFKFIVPVLLAFILFCQLIDFFGLKIPGLS